MYDPVRGFDPAMYAGIDPYDIVYPVRHPVAFLLLKIAIITLWVCFLVFLIMKNRKKKEPNDFLMLHDHRWWCSKCNRPMQPFQEKCSCQSTTKD